MIADMLSIVHVALFGTTKRCSNLCYVVFFGCLLMATVTEELETNDELREKWALNAILLASTASVSFDVAFGNLHWLLLLVKVMLFVPSIILRPTPENSSFVLVFYLHWYESLLGVVEFCRLLGTPEETIAAPTIVKPPIQPVVTPTVVAATDRHVSPAPVLKAHDDKTHQDVLQELPTTNAHSNDTTNDKGLETLKLWQIKDVLFDSTFDTAFDDDNENENLPACNVHRSDLVNDSDIGTLKLWQIKDVLFDTTVDNDLTTTQPPSPAQCDTLTIDNVSDEVPSPVHEDSNDLIADLDLCFNQASIVLPTPSMAPEVQLDTAPTCRTSVHPPQKRRSRVPKADRPPATRQSGRKVQAPIRFDPCPPSKKPVDAKNIPLPNDALYDNHSNLCVTEDLPQVPSPVIPKRNRNVKPKPQQHHSSRPTRIAGSAPNGQNLIHTTKSPSVRPKRNFQSKPPIRPNRNLKPNRRHIQAPSRLTAKVFGSWRHPVLTRAVGTRRY